MERQTMVLLLCAVAFVVLPLASVYLLFGEPVRRGIACVLAGD